MAAAVPTTIDVLQCKQLVLTTVVGVVIPETAAITRDWIEGPNKELH